MAKIFICGDVLNYLKKDGLVCSEQLADVISNTDYAIANFEAPIEGVGTPKPKSGTHHYQRKATVGGLKQQGFDLLCMANNHIMDYGTDGISATLEEVHKIGLDTIGAGLNFNSAYKPLIKTIDNVKVGFINACEAQFGVIDYFSNNDRAGYAWINHKEIDKQIVDLRKQCDFVIVLAHAGLEHYQIPQKEWRFRYKHFCELGADAVIGSHPHVPQGFEQYKRSFIFYSLGNFYFDSKNFRMKEDNSYSVVLDLEKDKNISFDTIFHHKQDGVVHLSPREKQVDIDALNGKLRGEYKDLHDSMSLKVYEGIIKNNLIYSLSDHPYDGRLFPSFKKIIKAILGRGKKVDKELLSLHLIRNEAYYFATRHAMELLAMKKHKNI